MSFCACPSPRQISHAGMCSGCNLRVQVKGSGWAPCILTPQEKTSTQPLSPERIHHLRAAHDVRFYQECGWACATGFDAHGRITVMVHAASEDEIRQAMMPVSSYR